MTQWAQSNVTKLSRYILCPKRNYIRIFYKAWIGYIQMFVVLVDSVCRPRTVYILKNGSSAALIRDKYAIEAILGKNKKHLF